MRPQSWQNLPVDLLSKFQINWKISSHFCGLLIKPKLFDLVNDAFELKHKEKDSNDAKSIVENNNSGFLRKPQKFDEISKVNWNWNLSLFRAFSDKYILLTN